MTNNKTKSVTGCRECKVSPIHLKRYDFKKERWMYRVKCPVCDKESREEQSPERANWEWNQINKYIEEVHDDWREVDLRTYAELSDGTAVLVGEYVSIPRCELERVDASDCDVPPCWSEMQRKEATSWYLEKIEESEGDWYDTSHYYGGYPVIGDRIRKDSIVRIYSRWE